MRDALHADVIKMITYISVIYSLPLDSGVNRWKFRSFRLRDGNGIETAVGCLVDVCKNLLIFAVLLKLSARRRFDALVATLG